MSNKGSSKKGWIWFAAVMLVILGLGAFVGMNRRRDLGDSFAYKLDEYKKVDPALIRYKEAGRIVPDLGSLKALAVAPEDRIAIAGDKGVAVYDPKGKLLSTYAVDGEPTCLAVDDAGHFYVGIRDHIDVLGTDGKRKPGWPAIDKKAFVSSIAVGDSFVYAADAANRIVWRMDRLTGAVVGKIGEKDTEKGIKGFVVPSPYFDLAIGVDDSLWVVNPGRHALENYRSDGELISSWDRTSMSIKGFSGCCNPSHVALLPDGSFVTSEKGMPRVKIHGPGGDLVSVVAGPDLFDPDVHGLDLAVDGEGRILVLDPSEGAVRIFTEKVK